VSNRPNEHLYKASVSVLQMRGAIAIIWHDMKFAATKFAYKQ